MSKFAVEESDHNVKSYHQIHKAGCRDLRDPERLIGDADTYEELFAVIQKNDYDYEYEDLELTIACCAPCAKKLLT